MNIKTANRLYELRKQNNLSQEELANKLGISREAISRWERAESSPSTDNLIALSELYNISLDELVGKDSIDKEIIVPEQEEKKKTNKGHITIIDSLVFLAATIGFLLLGFLGGYWSWGWLTFLLAVVISTLLNAIEDKAFTHFAYPVLVVLVYLFLGLAYPGIWHPTWVMFLTIPVYYTIAEVIDVKMHKNDPDFKIDDDDDDDK